jgi:cytochrome c
MRTSAFLLLVAIGLVGANSAQADDHYAFAESRGCLACHQLEVKVVGPSFKDIARKYEDDKTAESKLLDKVVNGGVGLWGTMPMHTGTIDSEDASILVKWILSMR